MAEDVARPFDSQHLAMDGRLPDGSRIHVIGEPVSRKGICVTIRKFREAAFTLDELELFGSIEPRLAGFRAGRERSPEHRCRRRNGTGKTSLLNALSRAIDRPSGS